MYVFPSYSFIINFLLLFQYSAFKVLLSNTFFVITLCSLSIFPRFKLFHITPYLIFSSPPWESRGSRPLQYGSLLWITRFGVPFILHARDQPAKRSFLNFSYYIWHPVKLFKFMSFWIFYSFVLLSRQGAKIVLNVFVLKIRGSRF